VATIGLLCSDAEARRELALLAGEAGHLVFSAGRLKEAVEILRDKNPRGFLVVDSESAGPEDCLREILRASPLLAVVAALKVRNASRAVELMRSGAAEVVCPPWTRESLGATLAKALRFEGTALSLSKPRPRRSPQAYLLAVLAFFGVSLGVLSVKHEVRREQEITARRFHWDMPYSHPSALAFDSGKLWAADWFSQSFYEHSPESLVVEKVIPFPAETIAALSFAPDSVWTADGAGPITRRMKDAAFTPLERYDVKPDKTLALAFDGLYLWTYDAASKRLRKRLLDDRLTILASYRYPGGAASALVFDGKTLWSLDSQNREIIRHNFERPDEAVERFPLAEYGPGGYKPVGLAFDGENFWTLAEKIPHAGGPARIFKHVILRR
jgi:hypothetical protein